MGFTEKKLNKIIYIYILLYLLYFHSCLDNNRGA